MFLTPFPSDTFSLSAPAGRFPLFSRRVLRNLVRTVKLAIKRGALDRVFQKLIKAIMSIDDIGKVVPIKEQYPKFLALRQCLKDSVRIAVHGDDDSARPQLTFDLE